MNVPTPGTGNIYGEAYRIMTYRADDGSESELIWNSRDGVTPFVIALRSGRPATHVGPWALDVFAPDHVPNVGDRVFVDITPDRAREIAAMKAALFWDHAQFPARTMYPRCEAGSAEERRYQEDFAGVLYGDIYQPGQPDLVVVTQQLLEQLEARRVV